jgi:hypothetical protein
MHEALKKLPAPAPRPSSRRDRRARRDPATVRHLVMPGLEVARAEARPRETVTAFLSRTGWATRDRRYGWQFRKGLPTILEINGEAVLRTDWRRRRIGARADVRFVSYPLGGNGGAKQILGLVSLIAVSAFAFWAGPIVAGALGFAGSALVGRRCDGRDRPRRLAARQCADHAEAGRDQCAALDAGSDLFGRGAGQHREARPAAAGLVWAPEKLPGVRRDAMGRVCRQRPMAQRAAVGLNGQHGL